MTYSVTIGSLAVLALTLAADSARRGILGERTRTAYVTLKDKIAQWANVNGAILEHRYAPAIPSARIAIAIERQSMEDQLTVKKLAAALIDALKTDVIQGSLGISIRKLEALQAQLGEIVIA
jgi:hypothetical protein